MKFWIITCVLCLLGMNISGQTDKTFLKVKLENNIVLKGELVDLVDGEQLVLNISGKDYTFPFEKIKSVRSISHFSEAEKICLFEEKGFYHQTGVHFLPGYSSTNQTNGTGIGVEHVSGYQWNRLLGAGVGIGMDRYPNYLTLPIYPLFGEVRGYFMHRNFSPFYLVKLGYGFSFSSEDLDARGGAMFEPSIGFRLSGKRGANLAVGLGCRFQDAHFETNSGWNRNIWWFPEEYDIDVLFRRFVLSVSVIY